MLTVQNIYDSFGRYKHDISDVETTTFIEWCDFIIKFLYENLKSEDPERLLKTIPYNVIKSTQSLSLPSDFMDIKQFTTGIYEISGGTLSYDTGSEAFAIGDKIVGATSKSTAIVKSINGTTVSGILTLKDINGVFEDNELIQEESLILGSALVNGVVDYDINNEKTALETKFGSNEKGFFLLGNQIVFTNNKGSNVLMRYVPQPPNLTALTDYFSSDTTITGVVIIEDRHKELLLKAIDLYYSQWDEDMSMEGVTDARFARILQSVLESYKRTTKVFYLENNNKSF